MKIGGCEIVCARRLYVVLNLDIWMLYLYVRMRTKEKSDLKNETDRETIDEKKDK